MEDEIISKSLEQLFIVEGEIVSNLLPHCNSTNREISTQFEIGVNTFSLIVKVDDRK